ncbi:MAG: hypothetical protein P4L74_04960 [Candidatus Doudnabacteria bacterium]|nr:hypothetical protein [Candidatus Doudnabacteria bacterium]
MSEFLDYLPDFTPEEEYQASLMGFLANRLPERNLDPRLQKVPHNYIVHIAEDIDDVKRYTAEILGTDVGKKVDELVKEFHENPDKYGRSQKKNKEQ